MAAARGGCARFSRARRGRAGVWWGDHLHAITVSGAHTAASLQAAMIAKGFAQAAVEDAESTLEDVFVELAGRGN